MRGLWRGCGGGCGGGQRGHIERGDAPGRGRPSSGAARSQAPLSRLNGRHPDQGGDLLAGAGAQFGHVGQQGGGGHGVEAQVQVAGGVAAPRLVGCAIGHPLAAPAAQDLQVLDHGAGLGAERGPYFGRAAGQDLGVQPVGLGQPAQGAGNSVGLARIDAHHRQAGRGQARHHEPLVAAAGFHHDAGRPECLELLR